MFKNHIANIKYLDEPVMGETFKELENGHVFCQHADGMTFEILPGPMPIITAPFIGMILNPVVPYIFPLN